DDPGDDIALPAGELLVRELAFRVPELLVDHLLGGLGPDAALELVGDLDFLLLEEVALLVELLLPHPELAGLGIELAARAEQLLVELGVVLPPPRLVGGRQRLLQPGEDGLERDAL